jgi:5-methylcytosine-specific restriction endonuclease McrA
MFRYGGPPPNPACVRCGVEIDLLSGKNGRRIHIDVKLCRRCKNQNKTEATPGELARRDGPYCQLCGCDVDLLAVLPDPMRPSVDHIVPRALGGDDSTSNNQLTHLLCNQIKSDRAEFSLLVS